MELAGHLSDELLGDAPDGPPPRGVSDTDPPALPIGDENKRAISADTHDRKAGLVRDERVAFTGRAASRGRQDDVAMNLMNKGRFTNAQCRGQLSSGGGTLSGDRIHVQGPSSSHEMRDAGNRIKRREGADYPAFRELLKAEVG
jgi:hypothetical protein